MSLKLEDLRNGDLIGWRKVKPPTKGGFYLNLVRIATFSEFGHVSVVWNKFDRVGHIEAIQPVIQHSDMSTGEAYVIRMGLNLNHQDMYSFFGDKIGLKYSFRDALLGYIGVTPSEEDRWQCAELCLEFYRQLGIDLPDAYTPSRLMRKVLEHTGKPMLYLQL